MAHLSVRRVESGTVTTLFLEGTLDATAALEWSEFGDLRGSVRLHLRGLTRIDSCGVRQWLHFVRQCPPEIELEYEQCSVAFVRQLNLIADFLGKGRVRSLLLPLVCEACDFETEHLVLLHELLESNNHADVQGGCPYCQGPLVADYLPEEYLELVRHTALRFGDRLAIDRKTLTTIAAHLCDGAATPAFVIDDDRRIVYCNESWGELLRRRTRSLIGEAIDDVAHFSVMGATCDLFSGLDGHRRNHREVGLEEAAETNLLLEIVPFTTAGAIFVTLVDLSAEAALQDDYRALWQREIQAREALQRKCAEIERHNAELARTEAALTRTIATLTEMQDQLVIAERLTALGQLSAALAHELNNPAGYVLTNLVMMQEATEPLTSLQDLLRRDAPDAALAASCRSASIKQMLADVPALIEDTLEGTRIMCHLLSDLKVFTHPGAAGQQDCQPNEALDTALRLVAHHCRGRVEVIRDLGEIPRARGDRAQMIQVFVNLLSNAIHAAEASSSPRIVVCTAKQADRVVISITDNGPGMSTESRRRAFDPFFTTKPAGRGTGLGLSLVLRVIQDIGGDVELLDADGGGTIARVQLPLPGLGRTTSLPAKALPGSSSASMGPDGTSDGTATPRRVLLVDDDDRIRRAIGRLLMREFDITEATDGLAAVGLLAQGFTYDVALVDLHMPDMSGEELLNEMRSHFPGSVKQVCMMTGGAPADTVTDLSAWKGYPVLTKPIEPQTLVRVLRELASA